MAPALLVTAEGLAEGVASTMHYSTLPALARAMAAGVNTGFYSQGRSARSFESEVEAALSCFTVSRCDSESFTNTAGEMAQAAFFVFDQSGNGATVVLNAEAGWSVLDPQGELPPFDVLVETAYTGFEARQPEPDETVCAHCHDDGWWGGEGYVRLQPCPFCATGAAREAHDGR